MPSIQFGLSSYDRAEGDFATLPVVNMYAEETPTEERGVSLQSRNGLEDRAADMGAGPVKAIFKANGVVESALLGVSGGQLYNETALVGAIVGTGAVSIAGNILGAFIAAGSTLYNYDGAALNVVAFPDNAGVIKVVQGASRFIALRANSGQFYWTDTLETDVEALDFATAESQADNLLDAIFIDDFLVLFGAETVEFWPNTTDNELPFVPLEGRVLERGIRATGCATPIGSSFAWVTNRNEVCISDEKNIISNVGLQERIEASNTVSMFTFFIDGVEFLALRLDDETQVWNRKTQMWSEFATSGLDNWAACCYSNGYFGSAVDGKTMQWATNYTDALAIDGNLERIFRSGIPINSTGLMVDNIQIRCNPGQTGFLGDEYEANPTVDLRMSRDAGQTFNFSRTDTGNLAEQGRYRSKVQWRSLGMASQPGFLAEFRVSAPVPFRVSDVLINEPYGGR